MPAGPLDERAWSGNIPLHKPLRCRPADPCALFGGTYASADSCFTTPFSRLVLTHFSSTPLAAESKGSSRFPDDLRCAFDLHRRSPGIARLRAGVNAGTSRATGSYQQSLGENRQPGSRQVEVADRRGEDQAVAVLQRRHYRIATAE